MTTTKISSDKFEWKGVLGYALYDWASSPVPTLHATFTSLLKLLLKMERHIGVT